MQVQRDETPEKATEPVPKALFGECLRRLMEEKELGVTALAKLVQNQLPDRQFNPVNISHYRSGRSVPRPPILAALAHALGVEVKDLIGAIDMEKAARASRELDKRLASSIHTAVEPQVRKVQNPDELEQLPTFHLEDMKDGQAWIQINQRLSWDMVIKLLQVLKGEKV